MQGLLTHSSTSGKGTDQDATQMLNVMPALGKFLNSAEDGSAVGLHPAAWSRTVVRVHLLTRVRRGSGGGRDPLCGYLTDALAADVLLVAHVALAAVAGGCRDAASVQTQVGEVFANVDGLVHGNRA